MSHTIAVALARLAHAADLPAPHYATDAAAGMDLHAAVCGPVTLPPGARATIGTGLSIALPMGYEAQVRPRSGLAARHGVTVLNSPGVVDADYRGEVKVILINHGASPFVIERAMRIAQMLIAPAVRARLIEVEALPETARGDGGFGSTGVAAKG